MSNSQTLYYEFWINPSFGRHLHSGDLLERQIWLCLVCHLGKFSLISDRQKIVMWKNGFVCVCFVCFFWPDISTASHFPSLSFGSCLISGLCMTNTLLLPILVYLWFSSMLSLFSTKKFRLWPGKVINWRWLGTDSSYYMVRQAKCPSLSALLFWNRTTNGNGTPCDHSRWEEGPGWGSQSQRTKCSGRKVS